MAFNSYVSSYNSLPSVSSIIASVLPSIFDNTATSDTFVRRQDLVEASKSYSLREVNITKLTNFQYPPVFLGSGASYRVYMLKLPQWKELVAVKYIKSKTSPGHAANGPSVEEQRLTVLREIHVLGQFTGHPNIVTLLGWGQSSDAEEPLESWIHYGTAYLITEYAPLGNLDSFLKERGNRLQSSQRFKICAGVAEGLRALHSQKIVHGDVKTANILIIELPPGSSQYAAKISDLGYAISFGFSAMSAHYRGTDLYNAPEIRIKGQTQGQELDLRACEVYSFGLLVWTVFRQGKFFLDGIGDLATEDGSEDQILDSVGPSRVLNYALQFAQVQKQQAEGKTLELMFSACLAVDPVTRLSISDVCQILNMSAPDTYTSPGDKSSGLSWASRGYQPHQPSPLKVFDVFECVNTNYFYELRQRLAQKLLNCAQNPKHPMASDIAYEVSKCFALGFGVPRDIVTMEYWLKEAAQRGHDIALHVVETLKKTRAYPRHNVKPDALISLTAEATTSLIKIHNERQVAARTKESNFFQSPMIFFNSIIEAELISQDDMSKGFNDKARCILHRTAEFSHTDSMMIWLEHHVELKICFERVADPQLILNIIVEAESIIQDRISQGLDVNTLCILHWAAEFGRMDLMKTCLKYGADVNMIDCRLKSTPLVRALRTGQVDAAELLLRNGAYINLPDCYGWAAGHYLFNVPPDKFHNIIELFHNAPQPTQKKPQLIRHSNIFQPEWTPLRIAASYGHLQAVETFLFDFEHPYTAKELSQALNKAVECHDAAICDKILRTAFMSLKELSNPFLHIVDGTHRSYSTTLRYGEHQMKALHSTIEVLQSYGFDINSNNNDLSLPAMCFAVSTVSTEHAIASALLNYGASLELSATCTHTILEFAIAAVSDSDEEGCVRWLLTQGVPFSIYSEVKGNYAMDSPLFYACSHNAHGAAKAILDYSEGEVNVICGEGFTPLHIACAKNAVKMVELLLEYEADVSAATDGGLTPLEIAVAHESIEVVRLFLARNLPVHNLHGTSPRSILTFGVLFLNPDSTKILQLLLQHPELREPETLREVDSTGRTILAYAITSGKYEFALDLLKAGTVNLGNPLALQSEWASLAYNHQCIRFYSVDDSQQVRQYHALLHALAKNLKSQNLIESCDSEGDTLLSKACMHGSVGAVRILLAENASVCNPTYDGNPPLSPLSYAMLGVLINDWRVSSKDWPADWLGEQALAKDKALLMILDLLLRAGADSNGAVRCQSRMPLTYAILAAWRLNSASCVERLCAHGANPNAGYDCKASWRALHLVLEAPTFCRANMPYIPLIEEAEGQRIELVKTLIRTLSGAGAKFDTLHVRLGKTAALAEALCQCNPIGLKAMLDEGVELHQALGTGQIAFKWAAIWMKVNGKRWEEIRKSREIDVEKFMKQRRSRGLENLQSVRQYISDSLWAKIDHQLKMTCKRFTGANMIRKLLDEFSFGENAHLNDMLSKK